VVLAGQAFEHRAGHYDAYHVPLRQGNDVTGVLIMFRDVTERNRLAEEATKLRLRQQQEVLSAILTTQETERKRIAEALHNGLGQLLYAAKLSLEGRAGTPSSPRTSLKLLHEAIRTTRTISFELTPGILEDFGLRTALEELSKRITPTGLPVHLHLLNLEQRLRPTVEIAVYRIVQELLNNIMKHAQATEVVVHVARENKRVEVSVEDNGRGFEPNALTTLPLAGMGLSGVRNRVALLGGELSINSRLGRGTIVSFEVEA
jgi:signal transduction histidine kinase